VPGAPEMPTHFTEVAEATWHQLCSDLAAMTPPILASSDVALMTLYCDAYSHYLGAERELQEQKAVLKSAKTGVPFLGAYAQTQAMFGKQLFAYAKELGLTHLSRPGISAGKPVDKGAGKFFKNGLSVVGA